MGCGREGELIMTPTTTFHQIPIACPACGHTQNVTQLIRQEIPFVPAVGEKIKFGEIEATVVSVRDTTPADESGRVNGWPSFEILAESRIS